MDLPALPSLGALLAETRRRHRRRALAHRLGWWATLGVGSGLGLVVLAALLGPQPLWRPLCGAWLAAQVALLALTLAQHRRTQPSDEDIARYIGRRVPDLRSDLLSAVQLCARPGEGDPLSAALIEEHCRRTVAAVSSVPVAQLQERDALWRALGPPLLLLLLSGLLLLWRPGLLGRGVAILLAPPPDPTTASSEPLVGDIRLLLTYPRYTGLPPRTIPNSSGDVLALPGTQVRIEARALCPVERAQLVIQPLSGGEPTVLPVQVVRKHGEHRSRSAHPLLVATFSVSKPAHYHFVIERARGDRVREGEGHRIEVEPDHPPRIDLFAPSEDLEISAARRVELAYSAEDDFGLGEIDLVFRSGSQPERRKRIRSLGPAEDKGRSQPAPRTAAAKIVWDLAELDLEPGLRVAYYMEARDLDDVNGPNRGVSRTFYLRISSPREKHEAQLARQEALREQALVLLADRIEAGLPGGDEPGTPELPERMIEIHRKAEALLIEIGRVQEELPKDALAPKELRAALQEMGRRLGKLTHEEEQLLAEWRGRREGRRSPRSPREIAQHNERQIAELERDVLLLDDLIGRQRLEQLLGITDEMGATRDRLRQLLAEYKKTRAEPLAREIEREIRELERRLQELADKARSLQGEIPEEFLNAEAMGRNDIQSRLDRLRDLLARGEIDRAIAELEHLSQSLESLVRGLEEDLRSFRQERFTAEDRALAEAENRLADLVHDQEMLRRETESIRAEASGRARQLLRDRAQELHRRLQDKVQRLRKLVQDVDIGALGLWGSDELDKAHKRIEDLGQMLEQGDLDEARAMAQEAEQVVGRLAEELRAEEEAVRPSQRHGLQRSRARLEAARPLAHEIAEEIGKALPQEGELLSPDRRRRLSELRGAQEALRRRVGELARDIQRRAKEVRDAPLLERMGQEVGEALHRADGHMGEAAEQLRQLSPRGAAVAQGQALEQMEQLRRKMQQARRPRDEAVGARLDREPVKIPGANEYRAPREFRQDILEAAKREAPAEYRDQVKRYYEELVK
ncbi:MAG: DUF4175 family protein [Myxococcota bacterium]|nr:DUF4175 family protein [Myxococcota bacterium]